MNDSHAKQLRDQNCNDDFFTTPDGYCSKIEDNIKYSRTVESTSRRHGNRKSSRDRVESSLMSCKDDETKIHNHREGPHKSYSNSTKTSDYCPTSNDRRKHNEYEQDRKRRRRSISSHRDQLADSYYDKPDGKVFKKKRRSDEQDEFYLYEKQRISHRQSKIGKERNNTGQSLRKANDPSKHRPTSWCERYRLMRERLQNEYKVLEDDAKRQLEPPVKRLRKEISIDELLNYRSIKERMVIDAFRPQQTLREYCPHITRQECIKFSANSWLRCNKIHYKKVVKAHTDETVGNCSYLNNCFNTNTCKYVHYEIETRELLESDFAIPSPPLEAPVLPSITDSLIADVSGNLTPGEKRIKYPPQWIQCDLRVLDLNILGKFSVIMADPPWDIHMGLPYGTMADDEMRNLKIPLLQDDGYIFLWVTGRAMELGRECLKLWGYRQVEEIVWLKTNQIQSLVRSGRTGHWLNHTKEHCIVGVKGNPKGFNRGLDCDVIVSEVRDTSHKPDEIYDIIERLSPGTRKIELFGRPHNLRNNWVTLGNQLSGSYMCDPSIVRRFMAACVPNSTQSKPSSNGVLE